MRRTRARTRRAQEGCPLFTEPNIASIIISKLAGLERASLALTCSLARTAVHGEVTSLDFRPRTSGSISGSSSSSDGRRALTADQTTQLLQRFLQNGRWARLAALGLPASCHDGICPAAAQVAQRWPHLRARTLAGKGGPGSHPLCVKQLLGDAGLLLQLRTQLTRLQLTLVGIDVAAAQRLAQAGLDGLQELCLDCNTLGDKGFEQLVLAGPWPSLTSLTVSNNYLTSAAGAHLAAATQLTALASLGLQGNDLKAAFMRAWAPAAHLRLTRLDLSSNSTFGNTGLCELLKATQLVGGLRSLALSNMGVGLGTIPALVAATCLSSLTSVTIQGNNMLPDTDFATLAAATHLSTLQTLSVVFYGINYFGGCASLAGALRHMALPYLTKLTISNAILSTLSAGDLASTPLPLLRHLGMCCTGLTKKSLMALAKADWPQLQSLELGSNFDLKADALMGLWRMRRKCPSLRRLLVAHDMDVVFLQAELAKDTWAELVVVHD